VPLKRNLFNLKIRAKYFSDNTYGIQFRSKAIVTFYNKVIGIPLGYKVKTVDIPLVIKNSPLEFKIACLRGIFDADFSLTFKKKYKEVHYYPVIRAILQVRTY
jgi:intein/homing endonuclease